MAAGAGSSGSDAFERWRPYVLLPSAFAFATAAEGAAALRSPHGSMVRVAASSPLMELCGLLLQSRGDLSAAPGSGGFELVAVDAVVNSALHISGYESRMHRLEGLRTAGGEAFNFGTHGLSAAKLHVLLSLMSVMHERRPDARPQSPHSLFVFHGPRLDRLASVCGNGLVGLRDTDAGYFGLGCYTTTSIEYAARYARGDFDTGAAGAAPRARSANGCMPVVMFAASVGMAYPVTPGAEDYVPRRADGHSQWFGKPLKAGFDCHVACVSQRQRFEAVERQDAQYMELVFEQQSQLLPVAVLWVRESP